MAAHQNLPNRWDAREKLREKGQFWTPAWVAKAMVAYVAHADGTIFDPAVGKGAFYSALQQIAPGRHFHGMDISPEILEQACQEGIFTAGNIELKIGDFIQSPPSKHFKAIVANPPYVRHHRLPVELKERFRQISLHCIGDVLDGRAGLHVYFLVQALNLLDKGGRLAFIMPADTCEGVFAHKLWKWISGKFRIDGVITFDHRATPFPGVDTNAIIFLIKNEPPSHTLKWVKCSSTQGAGLLEFLTRDMVGRAYEGLGIHERYLREALAVGLSRAPQPSGERAQFTLADFARVMRGVATGANEFFFLTKERATELGIPDTFLLPAVGRTRDADETCLTIESLERLEKKGRPTLLFSPNGSRWEELPKPVRDYLMEGEKTGLPQRALISTRKPWYKMEAREIPQFLFAYLGRRNVRFIRNDAGIIPLTGFLCIYPRSKDKVYIEKLWRVLQHPETVSNLQLVGKSYGSGAVKVEPRALERLPIASHILEEFGLEPVLLG